MSKILLIQPFERSHLDFSCVVILKAKQTSRFQHAICNARELYKQLTAEAQRAKETPQSFLIRVLDLRQKIIFASQEGKSGLKYDPALVQNMFLHTVLTGLQNDRIQSDLQSFLSDPTISDEVLLERLNVACSHETERQNKRKSERSVAVHVTQLNESKHQSKQTKVDLMSQLQSLSSEILQIKETIYSPHLLLSVLRSVTRLQ